MLTGLSLEEVIDAVDAAINPDDEDLAKLIVALVEEAASTLREPLPRGSEFWYEGCEQESETHYFMWWLAGLQAGSWCLPVPIPRAVLEGFRDRKGSISWRCEDCLTALANGARYSVCPTCGSCNLSYRSLAVGREWEYTPLTLDGQP
jgi:hypothetical protein